MRVGSGPMTKTNKARAKPSTGDTSANVEKGEDLLGAAQLTETVVDHRRLYDLFMQTPAMIAICKGPNLIYEFANPPYLEVVGKTDAIIGKPLIKVFPEFKGQEILKILRDVYKSGEPYTGSETLVKLDKNNGCTPEDLYFKFVYQPTRNAKGNVDGIMTHAVDVTEQVAARKRAEVSEEKLLESEERFRIMADAAPNMVWALNPDGTLKYANKFALDYLGTTFEEFIEQNWASFIHLDDIRAIQQAIGEAIKARGDYSEELRLRRKDGSYRWHISRAHAMRDDQNKVVQWIGSSTDIEAVKRTLSRKKQLEEATVTLKAQRSQLIALNEAKDEFISLASHQLRTPATGVKQYIGMVLEGFAGDVAAQQKTLLEQANLSNERQITIIDDLLRVAQVDAGRVVLHKRETCLGQLLQEIIDGLAAQFSDRRQEVIFEGGLSDVSAHIDQERMRMVLENIIDNASKYTPHDKKIELRLSEADGIITVVVQDEGVGISGDDYDKLFRKFSRLDNPLSLVVGGTGLGLYWAKKIVDLHGGSIGVESTQGKGSTFTIVLPVQ